MSTYLNGKLPLVGQVYIRLKGAIRIHLKLLDICGMIFSDHLIHTPRPVENISGQF
jgi:hypothetical protein